MLAHRGKPFKHGSKHPSKEFRKSICITERLSSPDTNSFTENFWKFQNFKETFEILTKFFFQIWPKSQI